MPYSPSDQRRRRYDSKLGKDVFETAFDDKSRPRPAAQDWRARAGARIIDMATLGHGPEVIGAVGSRLKGGGTYEEEAELARQHLGRPSRPVRATPPRRRPTSTGEYIAGGAASVVDAATLGHGDQVLGTLLSRFKGRGSYEDEVALSKRLRKRFRESG